MSTDPIQTITAAYKKPSVTKVKSGDTVKVHQKIKEGNKERVQVFQGLVIKTSSMNGHMARITLRRTASGVGVEKSFLLHSPLVTKVEVVKRSKVRRNYLSYMRRLTGKRARLSNVDFDRQAVNVAEEVVDPNETDAPVPDKQEVKVEETKDKAKEEETTEVPSPDKP